jgi:phosphatidylinositol alpha-1,6-mannosyltransferase
MRVAMLSAAPVNAHGWGRHTRDLVAALAAQNVAITLITARDAPAKPDLPLAAYRRILPSVTPAPRFLTLRLLAAVPSVYRLCSGHDVVHVLAEPYALAIPLARPGLVTGVVTAHGTYLPRTLARPVVGWLYRRVYQQSQIICVSSYTERQVQAALPSARTVVIPNGVDVARFQQPGQPPVKRGPTVLAVGQLKARKGYHVLAKAMRYVREAIPDAEAVFIGNDADSLYCDSLRAQLAADGLIDAVHILGRAPDDVLLGWYHAADVFALPALNIDGRFEGFGLVYLEASAAGLPVVGTRDCGAEDAIRDGETGFLVPQNDPQATAQALIRLLQNADLGARIGAAGAAWAQQNTWDQVARRVVEVYVSLFPARRGRG